VPLPHRATTSDIVTVSFSPNKFGFLGLTSGATIEQIKGEQDTGSSRFPIAQGRVADCALLAKQTVR
jgi:hypothetical protein